MSRRALPVTGFALEGTNGNRFEGEEYNHVFAVRFGIERSRE